eukprot:1191148-Prorocentrum_minimum.AAC.2
MKGNMHRAWAHDSLLREFGDRLVQRGAIAALVHHTQTLDVACPGVRRACENKNALGGVPHQRLHGVFAHVRRCRECIRVRCLVCGFCVRLGRRANVAALRVEQYRDALLLAQRDHLVQCLHTAGTEALEERRIRLVAAAVLVRVLDQLCAKLLRSLRRVFLQLLRVRVQTHAQQRVLLACLLRKDVKKRACRHRALNPSINQSSCRFPAMSSCSNP